VIRSKSLSVLGYTNLALTFENVRAAVGALHRHAAAGRINPLLDRVDLDDLGSAWKRAGESPHQKLVVIP
jgi:hypothetical protein